MKEPICRTMMNLAGQTWEIIQNSRMVQFQLKEETFTDLNMLYLKRHHPDDVNIKVFTKKKEGQVGADWEWWFHLNKTNWIGYRVQAKIINILSNEFEHLHYKSKTTYQCDKLIENALNSTPPIIPLYCFFLHSDRGFTPGTNNCQCYRHTTDLYGCSLTNALNVKSLQAVNLKNIIDLDWFLIPWHCLICCKNTQYSNIIDKLNSDALEQLMYFKDKKQYNGEIPDSFITKNPPQYVYDILSGTEKKKMSSPDKDIYGVMACSLDNDLSCCK